MGALLRVQVPP